MKIKLNSLKSKLVFSYIFIIFISFVFVAYFLDKNLEENSFQGIKSSLVNQAYLIESQIPAENLKKDDTVYLDALAKSLSSKIKCRITIVNNQGRVLADSQESQEDVLRMESHANRPEIQSALGGAIGEETRYSSTLKIDMLYIALPLKEGGKVIGALRLSLPLTDVQGMLFVIRKTIIFSLVFALGLAFVSGSLLTRGVVKPINRIIYASRRFALGDFSHKILFDSQDEIGELANILNKMSHDIEEKIKEAKEQNQKLAATFNSMIEGVIVIDKNGYIISINPTVEKIFSVTKEEAQGRLVLEAIRNTDIFEIINSVLKKGEFVSRELNLSWPVQRIFQINASPIFEKDKISGCLAVIHDITQIRKLENMRRDFVANVSHELKTPLTSIKGFVETLLEGALDDKENSRNFLKIIQGHSERLNILINDLLDLASIESKEIKLNIEGVKLKGLTDEVLFGLKEQLKKRLIKADNSVPNELIVKADQERLKQVLTNFIDNAIKFNKENGYIKIYSQDLSDVVKVFIEDSGIGIPAKDIPRIFERFYRVDKARSRELGGTGLGLSIVKHIVELHGGTVGVESSEGFGSKFWFNLPK